jgi:hypothetical protein
MISTRELKKLGFEVPEDGCIARRIAAKADDAAPGDKPAIRLPAARVPNKTEARFEWYARARWRPSWMEYEPLTLRLPSGTRYTPDYCARIATGFYVFEVKGPHIHSEASLRSFKEARAAFPMWRFVFAQWKGGEWRIAGDPPAK